MGRKWVEVKVKEWYCVVMVLPGKGEKTEINMLPRENAYMGWGYQFCYGWCNAGR